MNIQLGYTYRDVVTGFQGVAVATHRYISGCDRVTLAAPASEDGDKTGVEGFFDVLTLELLPAVQQVRLPSIPDGADGAAAG